MTGRFEYDQSHNQVSKSWHLQSQQLRPDKGSICAKGTLCKETNEQNQTNNQKHCLMHLAQLF